MRKLKAPKLSSKVAKSAAMEGRVKRQICKLAAIFDSETRNPCTFMFFYSLISQSLIKLLSSPVLLPCLLLFCLQLSVVTQSSICSPSEREALIGTMMMSAVAPSQIITTCCSPLCRHIQSCHSPSEEDDKKQG